MMERFHISVLKYFCCVLFHLALIPNRTSAQNYAEIFSSGGNLIIRSAQDMNISFETNGQCDILINKASFGHGVSTINRADQVMKDYETVLDVSDLRLLELQNNFNFASHKIDSVEPALKKFKYSTSNPKIATSLKEEIADMRSAVSKLKSLLSRNECQSNPCKNGGTCQDFYGGFHCRCTSGWQGFNCEEDLNECVAFNSTDLGCQNGGICLNKHGSYECVCTNGWQGIHCTTKATDCFSSPASEICGHGICVPQNNEIGRKCICDQGWKKLNENGACTLDVDECQEENPVCSKDPPVPCENTPGSFRCGPCPAGFTGNGQYCADINECELFNGGCSLNPKVQCINTPGSRKCSSCPPGYIGDGSTCTYKGVCRTNNGNCHPLAKCIEYPSITESYAECKCPQGYAGNGYGPRGCLPSPINVCSPNPCKFGRCILDASMLEGFRCICEENHFGKYCNQSVGLCLSNPCKNGGTCVAQNATSYSCLCKEQYVGKNCERSLEECGDLGIIEKGTLKYPLNLFSSSHCSWSISTQENKVFNISFSRFHIGQTDDCMLDYLRIKELGPDGPKELGKFCGGKLPGWILSTTNKIWINFRTTKEWSLFKMNWNSIKPQCNEIFNLTRNSSGSVTSPSWPHPYPVDLDCQWLLSAPAGKSIVLTFASFDIGNDFDCTGDYLEISSSFVEGKDRIDKKCGGPIPLRVRSETPEMRINFHSGKRNTHPGFQINYSLEPACGSLMKEASGIIISPNHTKDLVCFYQISHNLDLKTKLAFNSFSLKESVGCLDEFVALYEGLNTSSPLIGRYCGSTLPSLYISDSGIITVVYKKTEASSFFSLKYEAVCEEIFEEPSGTIHSIGFPGTVPVGLTCIYLIKQQPDAMISMQISSLDEDYLYYDRCDSSFIEIRDGDNENATMVETSFDYDDPDTFIYSSSNTLWIKLNSSSSDCTSSFMANYSTTSDCSSLLRNNTGSITFSNPRRQKRYCRWILQAPTGFFIQLYVTLLDFYQGFDCSLSHVNIYENNSYAKDAKLIGSYCGKRIPPSILIPSNLATITVATAGVDKEQDFLAHYVFLNETKVCGGNFFSKSGTIKSPQYPHPYPSSSDCVWIINVDKQHQIELKMSVFKMRIPCTMEYLEIRNGGSPFSPMIGRFCGTKIPKVIRSHTNQLYMHLVSATHVSIDRCKFMFTWEATTTGCGGKLTSAAGALTSPNYPEPYNSATDCQWSIIVSQGSSVQLVFLDLDLESKKFFNKCSLDFIEIFDGSSRNSKSLGRFCGTTFPQSLVSTNRRIDVYFKSDISTEGRGFNLHYRTICSNNFTGYGGVIESPNFPETYPVLQECIWHLKVTKKNTVNISFSHFDLEERGYHVYPFFALKPGSHINYLKVMYMKISEKDIGEEEKVEFKTYVGSELPQSITVPSDHVMLHFKTDTNLIGTGFRLEWTVNGCGGRLNKPGKITTPNYPNKYPTGIECQWIIEASIGHSVTIEFTHVDIEKQSFCPYDVIKVFNGPDATYPLLSSFCQMEKQIKLTSNGHLMHVQFLSDTSYSGEGFSADFNFVTSKCGGELSSSEGTISSPNFPKNFNVGDYCEWLVTVEANHLVELKFETLDLISSENCTKNSVKIYDGSSTKNALLATICDTSVKNFKSSSNQMLVVFKSDKPKPKPSWRDQDDEDSLTSQGFKATYFKACGSRLVASNTSGTLKLKPYSMKYSKEQNDCEWTIIAPNPDQKVALTVTRLHILSYRIASSDEALDTYSSDETQIGLFVYGGESKKSPLIGKYFNNSLPPTIVSGGSALHIVLSVDVDFFAIYHIVGANCGGTLTGLNGMFSPTGRSCEWTLQVAPGNEISVSFKNFNIPNNDRCGVDYLEIRERNATGPLRGIFCGDRKPGELTHQGSLWFFFKTEKDNNTYNSAPVGFLAEYATSTSVRIQGYRGEIASPLYPDSFSSPTSYSWNINVPGNSRINLTFEDFHTENFEDGFCLSPYLKVFDGSSNSAPMLGTFCGYEKPDSLESSSNNLFIEALMDSSRFDNKFLLKWRRIYSYRRSEINKTCGSMDIIDLRKVHKFNFTSPGYPHGYSPNLQCEWTFETESSNSLAIRVSAIQVGYSVYCIHDYIRLISDKLDKKVCNRLHLQTYNASRTLKVVFVTNGYMNGSGFAAEVNERCGGIMTESSGVITFDANSPKGKICEWKINVKPGRRISIEFLKFVTNSSNRCDNFVELKNGFDATSPNLGDGKFCDKPPNLKTTGNNLFMVFNGNPNNTEFKAVYREVLYECGGSFALSEKLNSIEIMSPNHPKPSEPFIECFWVIRSPPGTYIQVDFIGKFDMHSPCDIEAVELRDGGTHLSPLIDSFCELSPDTQFSSDNIIFVKYFTKAEEPGDGFLANVSIASCGGTYKSPNGKIEWSWSPGKPHNHQNCTWNIIAPAYDSISLDITFNGLKMNYFTCKMNGHFAVYEISQELHVTKKKLLADMCDSSQEKKISSISNHVSIEFMNIMSKFKYPYPISIVVTYNNTGKECTYSLNTDFGEFQSPNYPNLNYLSGFCVWTITVPKGRRITVNITDFDLEKYSATFRDGQSIVFLDFNEYYMEEIYYNSTKRIYKSSGNVLQVVFLSAQSTTHRGFKAFYTSDEETVCSQDFSADSGRITKLPGSFKYVCVYKNVQKLPINRTLALSINSTLSYKGRPNLALFEKSAISIQAEALGEYTFGETIFSSERPTTKTALVRTVYPEIFFEVKMKGSEGNFSLDYKYYPCGGLIKNNFGYIKTPNFPNKFADRLECAWVINLPSTERVKLTIQSMNLGEDCEKSYIDVYNGKYSTSPKIGRFCDKNTPSTIVSQKNNLLIEYHHDASSLGVGFNASFDTFTEGCGGTITNNNEIVGTPNYPQDYPNNAECRWIIVVPEGSHMTLSSVNRFQLEDSYRCSNDYVEISDWKNGQWTSLNKFCGRRPPQVTSTGNKLLVVFRSNDKLSGSGFQFKWQMKCGGSFRASTEKKYITSPGYPKKYENNLSCSYFIYSRDKLVIEFEDFALEGEYPECTNDNVTIFGNSNIQVYCGQVKPSAIHARYNVIIKFKSDVYIADSGFKLSFRTDECGEVITEPKTIIKRPSITPTNGRINFGESCLWNITAPINKTITMKFTNYSETYSYMSCIINSLEIYDGPKFTNLLAKICGAQNVIPVLTTTKNMALLSMKTMDRSRISFTVEITFTPGPPEGCGGKYKLNNTKILRPPTNYTEADCQWVFEVEEGFKIQFKIEFLDLPRECSFTRKHGSKNCTCSFIEIRDGSGPFSVEIDQFCANSTYSQVYTTSWKFGFLRFFSEADSLKENFRISVRPVKDICGQKEYIVDKAVRTITSPGYPMPYEPNINCHWTLKKWNFRQKIVVRFTEFDLTNSTKHEDSNVCSSDRIELDDGRIKQSLYAGKGEMITTRRTYSSFTFNRDEILQFCGNKSKMFSITTKNLALGVGFISTSEPNKGRGFKMEYFLSGCSTNYTQDSGTIYASQENNTDCVVSITSSENTTLSLYFNSFWQSYRKNCTLEFLEIYDGHSEESTRLLRYCGHVNPNPVFSSTNKMLLVLKSRQIYSLASFEATFMASSEGKGCGGKIFEQSGTISSPLYPNNYTSDSICTWVINVPIGAQIKAEFPSFQITGPCQTNYLKVSSYEDGKVNERTFCETDRIATLFSTNKMTITYKSSPFNTGMGWLMKFMRWTSRNSLLRNSFYSPPHRTTQLHRMTSNRINPGPFPNTQYLRIG